MAGETTPRPRFEGAATSGKMRQWLWRNRTSPRAAFVLRLFSLGLSSVFSLFWARLLVLTLGEAVYGVYLAFTRIVQLGGLGDLGIAGAVGVRIVNHLARGEEEPGRRLLANARGVFFALAALAILVACLLSPWLPAWCGFKSTAGAGSLPLLFLAGGFGVAVLLVGGYFQTLNYISGNVTWPVIPAFFLTQVAFLAQFLLARSGAPLWVQYTASVMTSAAGVLLVIWMLKISHSWLGDIWPLRIEWTEMRPLVSTSFFAYLCALGNLAYVAIDDLVVNAWFSPGQVPAYRFNYRLCELALTVFGTATYVALPAIVTRLLDPDGAQKALGLGGFVRLQKLQGFAGCVAAMFYLGFNDLFILIWQGKRFQMPLDLQTAFALNLAVSMAGDAALQTRGRLNVAGVRVAGITVGITALVNLGLSLWAARASYLTGIAVATVVAQSVMSFVMGRSMCSILDLPWGAWIFRTWLLPVISVGVFAWTRYHIGPDSLLHCLSLLGVCLVFALALARLSGIRWQFAVDEWKRLRASIR